MEVKKENPVYVVTNYDTRVLVPVSGDCTAEQFKKKFQRVHLKVRSGHGKLRVDSLMVKRGALFYHLCDSVPVELVLRGQDRTLHVVASKSESFSVDDFDQQRQGTDDATLELQGADMDDSDQQRQGIDDATLELQGADMDNSDQQRQGTDDATLELQGADMDDSDQQRQGIDDATLELQGADMDNSDQQRQGTDDATLELQGAHMDDSDQQRQGIDDATLELQGADMDNSDQQRQGTDDATLELQGADMDDSDQQRQGIDDASLERQGADMEVESFDEPSLSKTISVSGIINKYFSNFDDEVNSYPKKMTLFPVVPQTHEERIGVGVCVDVEHKRASVGARVIEASQSLGISSTKKSPAHHLSKLADGGSTALKSARKLIFDQGLLNP